MVFGSLTVVSFSHNSQHGFHWNCRCKCGSVRPVSAYYLRSGKTKSCRACCRMTHGSRGTVEYKAWGAMLHRCNCESSEVYHNYGGRGIAVCESWRKFENFYADMGPRPTPKHSIDRIDNDGNYEPGNCRWATSKQQHRNKRRTIHLTFRGETKSLMDWAEALGVSHELIRARIRKLGWSVEKALTTPRMEQCA